MSQCLVDWARFFLQGQELHCILHSRLSFCHCLLHPKEIRVQSVGCGWRVCCRQCLRSWTHNHWCGRQLRDSNILL